jgi:hypothetical protein
MLPTREGCYPSEIVAETAVMPTVRICWKARGLPRSEEDRESEEVAAENAEISWPLAW